VTWLIHMCDMTHSHVWHDSFTCVTWLIHMCDMTHSHVWHDSFWSVSDACVTWLFHTCDMTPSYARHDSCVFVTWLVHVVALPMHMNGKGDVSIDAWHLRDIRVCLLCVLHITGYHRYIVVPSIAGLLLVRRVREFLKRVDRRMTLARHTHKALCVDKAWHMMWLSNWSVYTKRHNCIFMTLGRHMCVL